MCSVMMSRSIKLCMASSRMKACLKQRDVNDMKPWLKESIVNYTVGQGLLWAHVWNSVLADRNPVWQYPRVWVWGM